MQLLEAPARVHPIIYRFGSYMLETGRRTLFAGSCAKPLSEKVYQILLILLDANGKTVDRATFFERVWPEEYVSDANLAQHMFVLRQLLGESTHRPSYIITAARKGYRLAVPSEAKIGLTMKGSCERCSALLPPESCAHICSYECTFCDACASGLKGICTNCGGELTRRPSRLSASARAEDAAVTSVGTASRISS